MMTARRHRPCLITRLAAVYEQSPSQARRANVCVAGLRQESATTPPAAGAVNGAKDGYQTGPNLDSSTLAYPLQWLAGVCWVVLLLLPATASVSAQQGVQIGVRGAYEFGLDPARSSNTSFAQWCACPDDGARLGQAVWYAATATHTSLFSERFGLASSLSYGTASSVFVGRSALRSSTEVTLESQEDSRTSLLQLDLAGTYRLNDHLLFALAGTLDLPLSVTGTSLERELPASPGTTTGIERQLDLPASDQGRGPSFGAVARGIMEIPLGGSATLMPALYARIDFDRLSEGEPLGALLIGGSTSVLFDTDEFFASALPASLTTAPEPPPRLPSKAPPTASITLYAVDATGTRSDRVVIHPHRERHRRQMPVPSTFRFLQGSEQFAEPYRQDRHIGDGELAFDSLAYLGVDEVAMQGLNIVGSRLRSHPSARISLIAMTGEEEPTALGVARAKHISRYLQQAWGIQEKRILIRTIAARRGARIAPQVRITSASQEILAPIEAEWIEQSFQAPRISMRRDIQAEAGVRRWNLDVHSGERILCSSSSDSVAGNTSIFTFDLAGHPAGQPLSPLVARLVVEDSAGVIITATDELAIVIEQVPDDGYIGEQLRYILPAELITAATQRTALARSLDPVIRNGAAITISVYNHSPEEKRGAGSEAELFADELRRRVGGRNVTIRIEERTAGKSRPGYDVEVEVVQSAPNGG